MDSSTIKRSKYLGNRRTFCTVSYWVTGSRLNRHPRMPVPCLIQGFLEWRASDIVGYRPCRGATAATCRVRGSAGRRRHPRRGRRSREAARRAGPSAKADPSRCRRHRSQDIDAEVGGGQGTPRQRSAATQRSAAARLARQKFTTLLRILRCRRMTEMTRTLPSNASQLGSEHHHYHNHHHFIV